MVSDVPLDGASPCGIDCGTADIHIRIRNESRTGLPLDNISNSAHGFVSEGEPESNLPNYFTLNPIAGHDLLRLSYRDGPSFIVTSIGSSIWVDNRYNATEQELALYLLGPVIGLALRLRNVLCLHASCVRIGSRAFAFMGPRGAGKSTVAAMLAANGAPILTDDVLAMKINSNDVYAYPGYPRLRLWQDSARAVFRKSNLPSLAAVWEKRYADPDNVGLVYHEQELQLGGVFVVGPRITGKQPVCLRMPPGEAVTATVANSYRNDMLDKNMRAREFRSVTKLVQLVPFWHLHLPDDLGAPLQVGEQLRDLVYEEALHDRA